MEQLINKNLTISDKKSITNKNYVNNQRTIKTN